MLILSILGLLALILSFYLGVLVSASFTPANEVRLPESTLQNEVHENTLVIKADNIPSASFSSSCVILCAKKSIKITGACPEGNSALGKQRIIERFI